MHAYALRNLRFAKKKGTETPHETILHSIPPFIHYASDLRGKRKMWQYSSLSCCAKRNAKMGTDLLWTQVTKTAFAALLVVVIFAFEMGSKLASQYTNYVLVLPFLCFRYVREMATTSHTYLYSIFFLDRLFFPCVFTQLTKWWRFSLVLCWFWSDLALLWEGWLMDGWLIWGYGMMGC